MLEYDIEEVDSLHEFWITDKEAFSSKFSTHQIEYKYEGKDAFLVVVLLFMIRIFWNIYAKKNFIKINL